MSTLPDASEPALSIDLDALAANFHTLRGLCGPAETAPVVKADAYGLGAVPVALRLWSEGARSFFVARLSEGEALRLALGPDRTAAIYVLDGCPQGAVGRLKAATLTPVLNGLDQVEAWGAASQAGRPAEAALQIDTGMNRLGLRPEEARALVDAPGRLNRLDITLVLSHLACSSDPDHPMNARQLERFLVASETFPDARRSLANSGGLFLGEAYRFDVARPGISLYGGGPFETPHPDIASVASLSAPVLQVRTVRPGESIGYGAAWAAETSTRAAILACGYADGALRSLSPSGYGWLGGRRCEILGRVSMDLIAINVSDVNCAPGDRVELFGANLPLDVAAAAAGTISYELLSRVAPRVRRHYRGTV